MKITKKILAVILVIAMITSLSAMAFAADSASLVLETTGVEDGIIAVTIVAKNGAGLETIYVNIKYDNSALTVKEDVTYGEFKDAYKKQFNESVLFAANTAIAADAVSVGVAFANHLYSNDEYAAFVKKYDVKNAIAVDAAKVEIATVEFVVEEGTDAECVTFELIDNSTGSTVDTIDVALEESEPVTSPDAPIGFDTDAPIGSDTDAPIKIDTDAPIGSDTDAPIGSDTDAPIKIDTDAPIGSDTDAPTTEPATESPTTKTSTTEPVTESTPTMDDVISLVDDKLANAKILKTEGGIVVIATVGNMSVSILLGVAPEAKIVDKDGKKVASDALLATGMKFIFNGEIVEIAVLGDVDGDAEISVKDARLELRKAVSLDDLIGIYLIAGKLGGDSVGVSEARKILRVAVSLDNSEDWLK